MTTRKEFINVVVNALFVPLYLIALFISLFEIGKFKIDIIVIPNNMEKYMAFMLDKHLVFLGSLQFLSSCLDSLVNKLPGDTFKHTNEVFQGKYSR